MPKKQIPAETVVDLRRRLNQLPPRSKERRLLVQEIAHLYGISEDTVYRALRENVQVRSVRRADRDVPRVIPKAGLDVEACNYKSLGLQTRTIFGSN
jgi:predicted DNA-binding transcriptional regulator AlpA